MATTRSFDALFERLRRANVVATGNKALRFLREKNETPLAVLPMRIGKIIRVFGLVGLLLFPITGLPQTTQSGKPETEKQKMHSKIWENPDVGKLTAGTGDVPLVGVGSSTQGYAGASRRDVYHIHACHVDAVVVGKVDSQISMMTSDETTIFTDVQISVKRILKDNSQQPLKVGSEITVDRPGGSVSVNGRKFSYTMEGFQNFTVGGEYLLFLNFMNDSKDYYQVGGRVFEIREGLLLSMDSVVRSIDISKKQDATSALADVAAAVQQPCK
jgi:hypothetical protein